MINKQYENLLNFYTSYSAIVTVWPDTGKEIQEIKGGGLINTILRHIKVLTNSFLTF